MGTQKLEKLSKLIEEMTASEIANLFDIDVWQIASNDIEDFSQEMLKDFIKEAEETIKSRK